MDEGGGEDDTFGATNAEEETGREGLSDNTSFDLSLADDEADATLSTACDGGGEVAVSGGEGVMDEEGSVTVSGLA
jgi:hypothetical protein